MTKSKETLQEIIDTINKKFPDEQDLKGFLGISKALIVSTLEQTGILIEKLKEFDNNFEVILLKRDLADLFSKIKGNLKKGFEVINSGTFNSVLKTIALVKEKVHGTYFSVVNEKNVRAEAELLLIKQDLDLLLTDTAELKKVKQEIAELRTTAGQAIETSVIEINTLKGTVTGAINTAATEIDGLKQNTVNGINGFYDQTKSTKEKMDTLYTDLVERDKTTSQSAQKIEEYVTNFEKRNTSIEAISKNVEQWNLDINTVKTQISDSQKTNDEMVKKARELLTSSEGIKEKLSGKPDEKGVSVGGLLQEADKLKTDVKTFLDQQTKKYMEQFVEIEGLVAGATSVGLAKAYQDQKNSYKAPLNRWSWVFIITLVVMTGFSGFVIYEQFLNKPIQNLNEALTALLRYLPFYVPTIWLVSHASKQQSQARRLQQEYAFKETNAKSFHGHKEQIEKLIKEGDADKELMAELLAQMIVITGQNPSSTLDNKSHNDKSPVHRFFDSVFAWRNRKEKLAKLNGDK